jgi:DTW domain-containing protein YfiP
VCYCASLTTIDTVTRIVILQHPRERDMPIGTARMAALCLPGAKLHVGVSWDGSPELRDATGDPDRPAILLWPGPGARDILTDPPAGPVTLIVVDGTWSQAKAIVRDNPALRSLPRYAFTAPQPSDYRVRREPRAEYVSTIEALMHVLGALEGQPERFRALLAPFRAMVDAHLARQHERQLRFRKPRPRVDRGPVLPREITERGGDLVCVVGEANAWPYHTPERELGDELVHWVAQRVGTGETLDVVVAPQLPVAPDLTTRLGLEETRLRGGVTHAELRDSLARFLRPSDVVCTWGHYGSKLLAKLGGTLPAERIDLRAVARDLTGRRIGAIEQFAESAGVAAGAGEPRALRRVRLLAGVVEAWRAGRLPARQRQQRPRRV